MNITKLTDIELAKLLAAAVDEVIKRDLLMPSYPPLALSVASNALKVSLYRFAGKDLA